MSPPTITVLLPVRRPAPWIRESVASLLAQTHRELEILLIGDAEASALLDALPRDTRLRAIARERPGIVAALNTGLRHAAGAYVARMDADDIAEPERLERQLARLETGDADFVGTRVRGIDGAGGACVAPGWERYLDWLNRLVAPEDIARERFVESPLPHPTWLAPRETWDRLGGYRDTGGPEDYDLLLRGALAGLRFAKPEPVLLAWREHPERLTRQDARYSRAAFVRTKVDALVDPRAGHGLDAGRGVWLAGLGRHASLWCRALEARGVVVYGFVDLDTGTRRRLHGRPVIAYHALPEAKGDALVIGTVAGAGAREGFRSWCATRGWREGFEYIAGA